MQHPSPSIHPSNRFRRYGILAVLTALRPPCYSTYFTPIPLPLSLCPIPYYTIIPESQSLMLSLPPSPRLTTELMDKIVYLWDSSMDWYFLFFFTLICKFYIHSYIRVFFFRYYFFSDIFFSVLLNPSPLSIIYYRPYTALEGRSNVYRFN